MSGPAALSAALPDGPGNGLAAIAADLIADPQQVHVAVILFDVSRITEKVDEGTQVATVRVRRIEPIRDRDDAATMRRLLQREFERRTGAVVLPFDLEEDVRSAFTDEGQGEKT